MATQTEISEATIDALRTEAGAFGDYEMVEICDRALDGDEDARAECARVVYEARANAEADELQQQLAPAPNEER